MRNRDKTEERIITAVSDIIAAKGFQGLGINSVAEQAGVSKILIYRYFGNFEGLMEAWSLKNNYWAHVSQDDEAADSHLELVSAILAGQIRDLRNSPVKREIHRWLISEKTDTGDNIMKQLEKSGQNLMDRLKAIRPADKEKDDTALLALITAGITHLALMSDRCAVYNGLRLDSEEDWLRLEKMIRNILNRQF